MDDKTRKYIAKYVEDLHSLVTHGLQPIGHQISESRSRDHAAATSVILHMQQTLQRHEQVLGTRMEALGTSPTTAIQDAAAGIAGVVAGFYNQVRTEAVAKSIRDDYTFLSHCAVSWLMLMTTARSLGDHDTEELAETGYRDTARLLMQVDEMLPGLVVEELKQDEFAAQDVSAWAQHLISDAWTRQKVSAAAG